MACEWVKAWAGVSVGPGCKCVSFARVHVGSPCTRGKGLFRVVVVKRGKRVVVVVVLVMK